MRKYSLNYAVKLSVKCRQTICAVILQGKEFIRKNI